jgi:hypothetical protein
VPTHLTEGVSSHLIVVGDLHMRGRELPRARANLGPRPRIQRPRELSSPIPTGQEREGRRPKLSGRQQAGDVSHGESRPQIPSRLVLREAADDSNTRNGLKGERTCTQGLTITNRTLCGRLPQRRRWPQARQSIRGGAMNTQVNPVR